MTIDDAEVIVFMAIGFAVVGSIVTALLTTAAGELFNGRPGE